MHRHTLLTENYNVSVNNSWKNTVYYCKIRNVQEDLIFMNLMLQYKALANIEIDKPLTLHEHEYKTSLILK